MIYVFLANGFEEVEALAPVDMLRRAKLDVTTVGVTGKIVTGSHRIPVTADITAEELQIGADMEMIVLPGGLGGVESILGCQAALDAVKRAWDGGKYVAAICAGPTVLAKLGITAGRRATCYPGCENQMGNAHMAADAAVIRDGRLITGTSAGCAIPFALALIEALKGEQEARRVASQIVIRA